MDAIHGKAGELRKSLKYLVSLERRNGVCIYGHTSPTNPKA